MKRIKRPTSKIVRQAFDEGKSIEEIVRNAMNNPNGIGEEVPPMYTERDAGVMPEYDIRTDKQLLAIAACDKYTKSKIAKQKGEAIKDDEPKNEGE